MNRKQYIQLVYIYGLGLMIGVFLTFGITFLAAYQNPEKTKQVHINAYGEADFEFAVLFVLGTPAVILTSVKMVKVLKRENVEKTQLRRPVLRKNHKV